MSSDDQELDLNSEEILFDTNSDDSSIDLQVIDDPSTTPVEPWQILIVDDDPSVHQVTNLVMGNLEFMNRPIVLTNAYSAKEAKETLSQNPNFCLAFIDVVMEEDHAGLNLVEWIRSSDYSSCMRIILRTGQPGIAPEEQISLKYDINDYQNKTDLSSQRMRTITWNALRNYRDLSRLESHRDQLQNIVKASSHLVRLSKQDTFAQAVISHLNQYFGLEAVSFHIPSADRWDCICCSAAIPFQDTPSVNFTLEQISKTKVSIIADDYYVFLESTQGLYAIILIQDWHKYQEKSQEIIDVYLSSVQVSFENLNLNSEIEATQKEILYTMGELAEARSRETGNHVKRVGGFCSLMAKLLGIPQEECDLIEMASTMHDIGKVAIPDQILNKPGKLTFEEFEIMKTHSQVGYELLNNSDRPMMKAAAIIAHQHHEKYNGSGYPQGLKGEDIHVYGRISAVMDVFDALASERCYKKAWPLEKTLGLLKSERGKHFDPKIIDLFFDNLDEFLIIQKQWQDHYKEK